jgi:hypothetical protein
MKKILILFLSVVLFASCSHSNDEPEVISSDRTVLAYFLTKDLSELQSNVVSIFEGLQKTKEASTALIYWDNRDYNSSVSVPSILKFTSDGNGNVNNISQIKYKEDLAKSTNMFNLVIGYADVVRQYSANQQSTDKDVMTTVLKDMISLSSTKGYGLIFGSHSESWIPSPNVKLSSRAFASTYENQLDIIELNEALINVSRKFDYILMDACMMGNIEVAYELQNTCNYFIASPMEVPGIGFPYSTIMPDLFSDNVSDYTTNICNAYSTYHAAEGHWGNCIAVKCSEVPVLTNELNRYITSYSPIDLSTVQPYFSSTTNSGKYIGLSYDILDFVNKLTSNTTPFSFINQLKNTVVARSFVTTSSVTGFPSFIGVDTNSLCGMGMYIPIASKSTWNSYLKQLLWGDASGWADYITNNNL